MRGHSIKLTILNTWLSSTSSTTHSRSPVFIFLDSKQEHTGFWTLPEVNVTWHEKLKKKQHCYQNKRMSIKSCDFKNFVDDNQKQKYKVFCKLLCKSSLAKRVAHVCNALWTKGKNAVPLKCRDEH
jgi:hypothetical protein